MSAKSCANPIPHIHPSFPAYPGTPLKTLEDWKKYCLTRDQAGNCAFLNYATNPGSIIHSADCGDVKNKTSLLPSVSHTVNVEDVTLKTVCFDNFRAVGVDRLCIFQNFEDGNVNVEQMDPKTRARNLQGLIESYTQEVSPETLSKKMYCLHHGDQASVGWTHMHIFDRSRPKWPDELSSENAYCTEWKNDSSTTAKALEDAVENHWNQCGSRP